MSALSGSDLRALLELASAIRVSILLSGSRPGGDSRDGPLRLKNLVVRAEQQLALRGFNAADGQRLLDPLRSLRATHPIWQKRNGGWCLILGPEGLHEYDLPFPVEDRVEVGPVIHIRPLLRLLEDGDHGFVLALSQRRVRLYRLTSEGPTELELIDTPKSLEEALAYDDPEKQHQFHTGTAQTPANGGRRAAVHFGHGAESDTRDDQVHRFLTRVSRGIERTLAEERAPMMLAGVDELLATFKGLTRYPHVLPASISGNPDDALPSELQAEAWPLLEDIFRQGQRQAVDTYRQLAGTRSEQVTSRLEDILPAAYSARIDVLFVRSNTEIRGRFDPADLSVRRLPEGDLLEPDLLDVAAAHTFLNGGAVYTDAYHMPEPAQAAAILRY